MIHYRNKGYISEAELLGPFFIKLIIVYCVQSYNDIQCKQYTGLGLFRLPVAFQGSVKQGGISFSKVWEPS